MPDLEKQMFSLLGNFYLSILQNEQQKERKKNTSNRKKLPCLCDKGNKNCKHDDVKKRAWAAKTEN